MRKLVYIGFPFEHHKGTHAGYHQIRDYVKYDYFIDCGEYVSKLYRGPMNFKERCTMPLCRRLFGVNAFPWHIFKCILLGIINNNITFHFIYGENSYMSFSRFIRRGNKVVCTFHQPFHWFVDNKWLKRLKTIDKIILVGKTEIKLFEEVAGKNKVKFIPHGIRTDFYSPDDFIKKEHLVLTVGNWLRDYNFANKVYQQLLHEDEKLHITVVALPEKIESLHSHPRLHCMSGISDEQLRDLYRRCSVLFLPLIRYTANNSLLEASACGCKIVIASDSQDNSYVPSNYLSFCFMDVDEAITAIKNVLSVSNNKGLVEYIQQNYSWEYIGIKTEEFLSKG